MKLDGNPAPLWAEITNECWIIMWRMLAVFAVSACIPAGVIFGLRVIGAIRPAVTP